MEAARNREPAKYQIITMIRETKHIGRRRHKSRIKSQSSACKMLPDVVRTQTRTQTHMKTTTTRRPAASLFAIVIPALLLLSAPTPTRPQYHRQRSPIYQPQAGSPLVSSNLQAYQSDQPASRQQQFQADLDNVIESTTTTNSNALQAFPLLAARQPLQAVAAVAAAYQQQQQQSCQLPLTWAGKWFQMNKETIRITNSEISDKGLCRDRKGDKYLFESVQRPGQAPCLVCLVINERHLNVLQYKESTCQPLPAAYQQQLLNRTTDTDHSLLDSVCSDITGDAQLESMFRLDTPATECPIGGKYQFTYDNCREPLSSLDSCIDRKQLNFKFSACQDAGESKSEVLKCYADWSEGNNYYMIGRLEHASNQQDKGKFRCFVYEKSLDGEYIQMAQTLEESCYGLINANDDAPRKLRLTARQPPASGNKCHFPTFIQSQSESWLSVDNSLIYMFAANSSKYQVKETREGNVIEEATCLDQVRHPHAQQQVARHHHPQQQQQQQQQQQAIGGQASRRYPPSSNHFNQIDQSHQAAVSLSNSRQTFNDLVYLVQITKNCYTTDYCVRFYRRTSGIVQIDYFAALPGADTQARCRNAYSGAPQTQIITSTNLEQQRCPFDGAYTIEAPLESDFSYNPSNIFICPRQSYLTAQCESPTRLRIHYRCSPARYTFKNLYCLGSWTTSGLVRLLLADDERQRYSAWYRDYTPPLAEDELSGSAAAATRSQHLLGLATTTTTSGTNNAAHLAPASIVDLQIALITAQPSLAAKPMQVRLTRRSHCSELQGYSSQGSLGPAAMSGSYAAPSASAARSQVHLISLYTLCAAFVLSLWQATHQMRR